MPDTRDVTPGTVQQLGECPACGNLTLCTADALVLDADGVLLVGVTRWCDASCGEVWSGG